MPSTDSPRILICRLSAIGDCILTAPLACALRSRFPRAYLAWAIEPAAGAVLQGHPALDELIVVPKGWFKSWRSITRIRRELRARHFEVAIDPQSLTKSALLAWLSGAHARIGFAAPRGRELSKWTNNVLVSATRSHLLDAQLELLRPLDIVEPSVEFALPRDAAAERSATQMLAGLHLGCPYAVLNVGAGWNSRLWPTCRYGRVARWLGETRRMPSLVVWSGEKELAWAEDVVANSGGHALLAPATSLRELQAILRKARMYLGSDTGPMHLAVASGTPCVVLFGTTRPEESGPYGSLHVRVQHRYQPGSSRQRRRAGNDAMREITCEMVTAACEQLFHKLDGGSVPQRAA
ncbi:MAG: glycosyltransferase family 9 protein [Pirellulaceae bacterium]